MNRHLAGVLLLLLCGSITACGTSGSTDFRPVGVEIEVHFALLEPAFVHLRVIDEDNDILKVLLNSDLEAGTHVIPWSGEFGSGGRLRTNERFRLMIGTEEKGLRQTAAYYFRNDGRLVAGEEDTPVDSEIIRMGTL